MIDWSDLARDSFATHPAHAFWKSSCLVLQAIRQGFVFRVHARDKRASWALFFGYFPILMVWFCAAMAFFVPWQVSLLAAFAAALGAAQPAAIYIRHIGDAARALALRSDPKLEARIAQAARNLDHKIETADGVPVTLVSHSLGAAFAARVLAASKHAASHPIELIELGGTAALMTLQSDTCVTSDFVKSRWSVRSIAGKSDVLAFAGLDTEFVQREPLDFNSQFGKGKMARLSRNYFARHFLYFRATRPGSGWTWFDLCCAVAPTVSKLGK